MNDQKSQLVEKAKQTIDKIIYLGLSTVDEKMQPLSTPVYAAPMEHYNFYWLSTVDSHHSNNIRFNPKTSAVVYDSTVPHGQGFGVYFNGISCELAECNSYEIEFALELLSKRINVTPHSVDQYLPPFRRRVYRFLPLEAWVNICDQVDGQTIDKRLYITDDLLSR